MVSDQTLQIQGNCYPLDVIFNNSQIAVVYLPHVQNRKISPVVTTNRFSVLSSYGDFNQANSNLTKRDHYDSRGNKGTGKYNITNVNIKSKMSKRLSRLNALLSVKDFFWQI